MGNIEQDCSEQAKAPIDLIHKDKMEESKIIHNDKSVNESLKINNQIEKDKFIRGSNKKKNRCWKIVQRSILFVLDSIDII